MSEKRVLVTGASSGIGKACVEAFAGAGYKVLAAGRSEERLAKLKDAHPDITLWSGDIRDPAACARLAKAAEETFGALDCLVNAAGVIYRRTVEETSDEEWRETLEANLHAPFYLSRACLPLIRAAGGGSIVNIASDWGMVGGERAAAYCASKGGLVLLTRAMARDHAREGIRINAVCPGDVDTPMLTAEARQSGNDPSEALAASNAESPSGRVTLPEEVASLVLFLASGDSKQINGAAYVIDGGATA